MVQALLGLAEPPRPADAADAAALALCHLAMAPLRAARGRGDGGRPMIGSLRGTLLERGADGEVLVEVGGVGYRVTVTPRTAGRAASSAPRCSSTSTTTSARTRRRCTASPRATSGRASRRCSAPTASGRRWPWPSSPSTRPAALRRVRGRRRRRRAVPRARRRQEDRGPPALELKARLDAAGARRRRCRRRRRRRRRPSAQADVREALAGLGYGTDEIRDALRELPDDGDAVGAAARRPQAAGGARRA